MKRARPDQDRGQAAKTKDVETPKRHRKAAPPPGLRDRGEFRFETKFIPELEDVRLSGTADPAEVLKGLKNPGMPIRFHLNFQEPFDEDAVKLGVSYILQGMGCRLDDPNFSGTPARVARMYRQMLSPNPNNWKSFPARASDLVLLRGHKVVAICPHHLMPVVLTAYVAYIPNKSTVGLSKLARAVEEHLTKPVLQEDLAEAVASTLEKRLEPKGVAVVLAGRHGCMAFRGIESDADVVTSVMKGVFLLNPAARAELQQLIGRP